MTAFGVAFATLVLSSTLGAAAPALPQAVFDGGKAGLASLAEQVAPVRSQSYDSVAAQQHKDEHGKPFNPLEHMSGIAPYHDAPGASILPPPGCRVSAAAFLIRHSCIYGELD